jgi:environmental stress-induced protein Ves
LIVTPGLPTELGNTASANAVPGADAVTGTAHAAAPAAVTTLLRGVDLVAAPWKNGGGVTREVAAFPAGSGLDAFVWRVSIADVAQAGPFSRFGGIDRTLVLLSGAGMLLDEAQGPTHTLTQPLDIARFAGETAIDARLVDGATRDLNLMVRRGAATGELEVWRSEGAAATQHHRLSADVVLLFCAEGSLEVTLGDSTAVALARDDTLHIEAPEGLMCKVSGAGALLAIRLRYA